MLVWTLAATSCARGEFALPRSGTAGAGPTQVPPPAAEGEPCEPASLADRAARVLVVGLPNVTRPDHPLAAELRELGVGGVLLTHANVESEDQVGRLVAGLEDGWRGPLLVSVDEEPGRVRTFERLWGYVPSPRDLARNVGLDGVRDVARSTGERLARLGVDLNLAPVADLYAGPREGIVGDRSFSDDPARAADFTLAYSQGLWEAGVAPAVKHFPGHGRAADDSHVVLPSVSASLDDLRATDLAPFAAAVQAGAPVVMMGNVAYDAVDPGVPASLSPRAYGLLRQMGFRGVAMTDSIGMGAVNLTWNYGDAAVAAVAAGADAVLATDGWGARWMRDDLVAAVRDGRLPEARLDEAAARVTALAGGDPRSLTCRSVDLPRFR